MEIEDPLSKEKMNKYNPSAHQPIAFSEGRNSSYSDQQKGIVSIERKLQEPEGEFHTMQEQHNANHALYYFSIISDALIWGRATGNDREKIKRIREHMMNLREYIDEDKTSLEEVIHTLLRKLETFCPMKRKQAALFVYENWTLIRAFAEAYGHHDRCFPNDRYEKLRDVVLGRHIWKLWWWQIKAQKLRMKLTMLLKRVRR